jgi:hypothetical protein
MRSGWFELARIRTFCVPFGQVEQDSRKERRFDKTKNESKPDVSDRDDQETDLACLAATMPPYEVTRHVKAETRPQAVVKNPR